MNMLVRIITFLVLCGFCTSQTSDIAPDIAPAVEPVIEEASKHCNGELLAKNEYDHSKIILDDIELFSTLFDRLKDFAHDFSVSGIPKILINRVTNEYMNTVLDYQASWKESLKYITHATQLININNSIPYSNDVVNVVDGMRKENHLIETFLSWLSESYDTIYDCVFTSDLNCSIDGKNYVLSDIETTEYADDVASFREMNPQLLTIYYDTRQQFTLFNSMILWFRILKFTNTNFDETTTKWLSDGFKLIDDALVITEHEIENVHKDIKRIGSLIEGVNNNDSEVSELMEYLPTIKFRLLQMGRISSFLDTKVDDMTNYSSSLWDQNFPGFAIWPDVEDQDKHEISPAYTLREDVGSILKRTRSLSVIAVKKSLTDISSDYENDDRAMARCFQSLDAMLHKFCSHLTSSVQGVKETFDPMRYLAQINILMYRYNLADEDLGAIFGVFKKYNKKFLTAANEYVKKLKKHPVALKDYLGKSSDAENSYFTGDLPSDDDVTTFISFLGVLSETFEGFLDILSKTQKSAIYSKLVLTYDDVAGGIYFDTFDGDELVHELLEREGGVSLKEFMTSMNDYYTSKKIKSFYKRFAKLIDIYDDAYEAFNTHDPDEDRATKMNAIVVRLTTQKGGLADMTTNGNRFYEMATHIGLEAVKSLYYDFQHSQVDEDEYGDFIESTEYQFFTEIIYPESDTPDDGKVLDYVFISPAEGLLLERDRETVGKISLNLTAYESGDTVHIFLIPSCGGNCTYKINFKTTLVDAKLATGCYDHDVGAFFETSHFVTGDNSSVLISQSDLSGAVDIIYLDQYNQMSSVHYTFGEPCRIYFGVVGTLTFTWNQVTAAIVDIPTDASESALYNVYDGRTASEFEKKIYVRKGVYLEDENGLWSSFTLTSDDLRNGACIFFGVLRETVNKYGKVELTGFMYDGNTVVFNPDSACRQREVESDGEVELDREVESGNLDSVGDNAEDREDEVLYMFYRVKPDEDSNTSTMIVKLSSNKKTNGFMFKKKVEGFKYAPSYVTLKLADQVIHVAEPTPLDSEPAVIPTLFKIVCTKENNPCKSGQYCNYKDVEEPKFGFCKTNKAEEPVVETDQES